MDNLIQFIGRLHPLIVHLPVGIIMLAIILHLMIWRGWYIAFRGILPLIWLLAFTSSVVACVAGYSLSLSGGYAPGAVDTHMWLGFGLVLFSAIVFVMLKKNASTGLQVTAVLIAGVFLLATGHYGGNLTHGEDYLTEPLYAMMGINSTEKQERPPITDVGEALIYQDLIQPVLENKCYQCHGATKQKGMLRLDTQEGLLKGGDHGVVMVAGDAAKSPMYTSLILPESDDAHMPPKGKPQPTDNEIALIEWWLTHGKGSFSDKVADIKSNDKMQTLLASFTTQGSSKKEAHSEAPAEIPDVKIQKADPEVLRKLKELGVAFTPLGNDHIFLGANMVNNPKFNDKQMELLLAIKDQLIWLDMSDTKITDKALQKIGFFKYLTRLSLDNTAITNAALENLSQLKNLQYLNLYGTEISDVGLQALKDCKSLSKVYLWQTSTTPEGIAGLKKHLNTIEVVAGIHSQRKK